MRRPSPVAWPRAAVAGVAAVVGSGAGVMVFTSAAVAEVPTAYGWWYEANSGLPVAPPSPPSVPPNGLYIENGFNGPAAISALSFSVPNGAAVGDLVLDVAGTAVMTQPPVACPLSSSFMSTQEGEWAQRPSYDCSKAQVTGQVNSTNTTVTFDASSLLQDGQVSVAILAGGPADSVAFDPPGSDALVVTPLTGGPSAGTLTGGAAQNAAAPTFTLGPQGLASTGASPQASPVVPGSLAHSAGVPAHPGRRSGGAPGPYAAGARAARGSSLPTLAARLIGLFALVVLLVAWTEGYGLMGGRIKELASPLTRSRSRPAHEAVEQLGATGHDPLASDLLEPLVPQAVVD